MPDLHLHGCLRLFFLVEKCIGLGCSLVLRLIETLLFWWQQEGLGVRCWQPHSDEVLRAADHINFLYLLVRVITAAPQLISRILHRIRRLGEPQFSASSIGRETAGYKMRSAEFPVPKLTMRHSHQGSKRFPMGTEYGRLIWTLMHTDHIPCTKWGPIEQIQPESKRSNRSAEENRWKRGGIRLTDLGS